MEWATSTAALYSTGAFAAAALAVGVRSRVELSKAKHASLTGHSRMARRVASLVPFYDYGDAQFFNADGAPDDVASARRTAFAELAALYRTRYPRSLQLTA